jgi:hypothetical protein
MSHSEQVYGMCYVALLSEAERVYVVLRRHRDLIELGQLLVKCPILQTT